MTNTSNSMGNSTIYLNVPPTPPVDTDLRVRVLGLAVQNGAHDPVAEAERMLAFVEGRADAPDSDCVTLPDGACVADVCKLHDVPVDTDEFDEDEYEDAFDDWYRDVAKMIGKEVRVTLATNEDGTKVISEGILLGFGEGGDFEVLEDDGFVHFCWPMLDIEVVADDV